MTDVARYHPGLLDAKEQQRLLGWLRHAPWDRLVELDDDAAAPALLHDLDAEVFRTWKPAPGTDLPSRAAANKERCTLLIRALLEGLHRCSDQQEVTTLCSEIAARRGRRHVEAFLQALADDHVAIIGVLESIRDETANRPALPYQPETDVTIAHFQHAPSLLLRPEFSVVPFVLRDAVLRQLVKWCTGPARADVAIVVGPGGSGKTRLALELCRAVRKEGWTSGFLSPLATPDQIRKFSDEADSLVVVDYAENRREQIGALLATLPGKPSGRLRALLLVRDAINAGQDAINRLGRWHAGSDALLASAHVLELTSATQDERHDLFSNAVSAFGEALGRETGGTRPPDLGTSTFENPLFVLIAALAAVLDDAAPGATRHRDALLSEVIARERSRWRRRAVDAGVPVDAAVVGRAVALATLVGAANEGSAAGLLSLVPDLTDSLLDLRHRLARLLHELYPGPDYLSGLGPDLLGEALVREAIEDMPTLLRSVFDIQDWARLAQALAVVARAAVGRPDIIARVQAQLEEDVLVLAVRTWGDADESARTQLADALADLLAVAPVPNITYCFAKGAPHNDLAVVNLAVEVTRQGVDSARELAADFTNHRPDLAERLVDLSGLLAEAGRPDEAVTAAAEAAELYQELAREDGGRFLPDLSASLTVLVERMAWAGDHTAIEASAVAVSVAEELVTINRSEYLDLLGHAIRSRANCLARVRRFDEAVELSDTAIAMLREVDAGPWPARDALAAALGEQSRYLLALNRHAEALVASTEAVGLVSASPSQEYAASLHIRAICLVVAGRFDEAVETALEGVRTCRALVAKHRLSFLPNLAQLLACASNCHAAAGQHQEALVASEEAVDLFRQLTDRARTLFLHDLAQSLINLSESFAAVGRPEEALAALLEAGRAFDELADTTSFTYATTFKWLLESLFVRLRGVGRDDLASAVAALLPQDNTGMGQPKDTRETRESSPSRFHFADIPARTGRKRGVSDLLSDSDSNEVPKYGNWWR